MRKMTKADARRVSALHEEQFGVAGCMGCLDCMHVFWRLCPMAWHGQFEGKDKDKGPSIVLEAMADYNCWFWHSKFGYPGTLNDINIWDQSELLRSFIDGTVGLIDFPFRLAGKEFNQLWVFVDGIYPELSRFVKTITVPITKAEKLFASWQESSRKAVERAFGILQRKFQILTRPMEHWYQEDIKDIVDTCIILHNMMVEVCLSREEAEEEWWYRLLPDTPPSQVTASENENPPPGENAPPDAVDHDVSDGDVSDRDEEPAYVPTVQERIAMISSQWPQLDDAERKEAIREAIRIQFAASQANWEALYDRDAHFSLRAAIIMQLEENETNRKKKTN
jgi:Plant transposon protein